MKTTNRREFLRVAGKMMAGTTVLAACTPAAVVQIKEVEVTREVMLAAPTAVSAPVVTDTPPVKAPVKLNFFNREIGRAHV